MCVEEDCVRTDGEVGGAQKRETFFFFFQFRLKPGFVVLFGGGVGVCGLTGFVCVSVYFGVSVCSSVAALSCRRNGRGEGLRARVCVCHRKCRSGLTSDVSPECKQ